MSRSAVTYLCAAGLFIASSGSCAFPGETARANPPEGPAASSQEAERDFAERAEKAQARAVAILLLEAGQRTVLLDTVRRHPNTTIRIGRDTVTGANVEEYARRSERERQVLSDVIRQRGFMNVAGVYDLRRDLKNECKMPSQVVGPVTITQDDFIVELEDPANLLTAKGIIVESSMAAESSQGMVGDVFLVGEVANGQVEIGIAGGGIQCRIGILSKQ
jgi:hypothetical protein